MKVEPTLVDRVQDRYGRTIYKHDNRACQACSLDFEDAPEPPALPDNRERVEDPRTAYQITSMLEGAIQRGTGTAVRSVGVPLAGKTGTSNEARDTWFMGYSPNLVVGVFVGFDEPAPLGRAETGGRTAAPIFRDFMAKAIGNQPAIPFRIPSGINLVKVDLKTGALATGDGGGTILEAFREGTEPRLTSSTPMLGIAGGIFGRGDAGGMDSDISSDFLRGMEGDAGGDTNGFSTEAGPGAYGPATRGPVDPFALPAPQRSDVPFAGMPADEAVELDRPGGVPLDSERDDPPTDNRPPPPGGYAAGGRDIGSGTGGLY
ncbi:MAG: penicillin-binding protein, partial [Alphaproteobacteria bacterium HGW-Alphaproteobacteria-11]